jgi:U3 small nucleolar RNA-associated protein 12
LEETFESDLDNSIEDRFGQKGDDAPEEGSVGVPGKKTKGKLTAADAILTHLTLPRKKKKCLNEQKVVLECINNH